MPNPFEHFAKTVVDPREAARPKPNAADPKPEPGAETLTQRLDRIERELAEIRRSLDPPESRPAAPDRRRVEILEG